MHPLPSGAKCVVCARPPITKVCMEIATRRSLSQSDSESEFV